MKLLKNMVLCKHCNRNGLLPYENELSCISCGYNVIKRKHELTKIQRKRTIFNNRIKYAEYKIFCICIKVYKTYEGNVFDRIYEVLFKLKNE